MDLKTRMPRDVLLGKIKKNRDKHLQMLEDSKKGFLAAARLQLDAALSRLASDSATCYAISKGME